MEAREELAEWAVEVADRAAICEDARGRHDAAYRALGRAHAHLAEAEARFRDISRRVDRLTGGTQHDGGAI